MSALDDLIAAAPQGVSTGGGRRGKCPGCGAENEVAVVMQIRDTQNRSGLGKHKGLASASRSVCAACATQALAEFKAKWSAA